MRSRYRRFVRRVAITAALLSDLTAILAIAIWAPKDDALSGLILGVGILVVIPFELAAVASGYFAWRARRLHTAGVIGVGAASLAAIVALALAVWAHQSRLDNDSFAIVQPPVIPLIDPR